MNKYSSREQDQYIASTFNNNKIRHVLLKDTVSMIAKRLGINQKDVYKRLLILGLIDSKVRLKTYHNTICKLVREGNTFSCIGHKLGIHPNSIKDYCTEKKIKFGVKSKKESSNIETVNKNNIDQTRKDLINNMLSKGW